MSALRETISAAARGLRAFLSLAGSSTHAERTKGLESGDGIGSSAIRPENLVWMFGNARTGSTWLALMMGELRGQAVWREPHVGQLFGGLYYNWVGEKHSETKHFILDRQKSWLKSARYFVLSEAGVRFPEVKEGGYLIIKEPNGSVGAPLMMEALPESRLILLTRDPRDVVASSMDARREGGWRHEKEKRRQADGHKALADRDPLAFARGRAKRYLEGMGRAKEAYDAHRGYKTLVRYEDLRADALGTMKRMYSELGIAVDEGELARAVEKHSWEQVPEQEKGEGKFYRKAKPGGWREDLTPEQAEVVEEITAPLLKQLYPHELRSADPAAAGSTANPQQEHESSGA